MLYLIAEQLGFPGILNLIRYISFRAGAASATALLIGLLLGPEFIGWLRAKQGKGQPIRSRRPAEPPRQARHADHGRADDPDLGRRSRCCCGWTSPTPMSGRACWSPAGFGLIGFLDDYDKVQEGAPRGPVRQDPPAARIPDRRRRHLADGAHRRHRAPPAVRQGDGDRPRLVLHLVRRVRDRRVRQCGEPDRRARRARDHAGDHRQPRLRDVRLSRRQRQVRRLSRHPARARRGRPHRAAAGDHRRGARLPVVQRAPGGGLHGRYRQPRARRRARRGRGRDAPRVRAGHRRRHVRGRGAVAS